ncbi:type II toxin-antitoxin system RelE/ParE family toxin [Agrobacterium rosae]
MIAARTYSLSSQAIDDLIGIYKFLEDKNPAAAKRLVSSIEQKIQNMAGSGHTGVARDCISKGLRALPYRDRCIYFRVKDTELRILRIVHGHQHIEADDIIEKEN